MKKLYILVIALVSTGSLFAQDHDRNHGQKDNDRNNQQQQWSHQEQYGGYKDQGHQNNDRYYNERQEQMREQDRRAAIEGVNRDYDQRIYGYRNDRSMNRYERERRIAQAQRERQQKIGSFGKGMVAGAVVGLLAGVLLSH